MRRSSRQRMQPQSLSRMLRHTQSRRSLSIGNSNPRLERGSERCSGSRSSTGSSPLRTTSSFQVRTLSRMRRSSSVTSTKVTCSCIPTCPVPLSPLLKTLTRPSLYLTSPWMRLLCTRSVTVEPGTLRSSLMSTGCMLIRSLRHPLLGCI